jgi:hypothetical protein
MQRPVRYLTLYSNYLTIKGPKEKGFTGLRCPFHDDSSSASAGIDLESGVFSCKACNISLSPAAFIAKFRDVSIQEAGSIVDSYRIENNLKVENTNFSKKYIFALEKEDWRELYRLSKATNLQETFAVDYARERGFDVDTLVREGVGFLPAAAIAEIGNSKWGRDSLVFPYFYGGKIVALRYRSEFGDKSGEDESLMVPWGIDTISPFTKKIIVVEGESDRLKLLYELNLRGLDYCVISTPGSFFRSEWERDFVGIEQIVIIPDSDASGQSLVKAFKDNFGETVSVLKLPWRRGQAGKDLCDWAAPEESDFDELITELELILHEEGPNDEVLSTSNFLYESEEEQQSEEVIRGFIYQGQVNVIAGPQKAKKTWLMLNMVKCIIEPETEFLGINGLVSSAAPPNILYVQCEGSKKKFRERIRKVLGECLNIEKVYWWFKPGIKLDNEKDLKRLEKKIRETNAQVLILDPFQRLHTQDEDSSSKTAVVWDAIFSLSNHFPKLAVEIVHHFGKDKTINERWNAIRGSSRMGGEVDGGLFIENKPASKGDGSRIAFEFRDEERLETADGKDIFEFNFDKTTGILTQDKSGITVDKSEHLEAMVKERKTVLVEDALTHFGVSLPILTKWVSKLKTVEMTKSARPKDAKLVYVG